MTTMDLDLEEGEEFVFEWACPPWVNRPVDTKLQDKISRFAELGLGVDSLERGMKVVLKLQVDPDLPDNPGLATDMNEFLGKTVTITDVYPGRRYCGLFRIEEDHRWDWDPRWIDYVVPAKDDFEAASDEMFAQLFK